MSLIGAVPSGDVDPLAHRVAAPAPGPRAARARELVVAALEASSDALAAWEGGSAAFGRADLESDLDVCVLCRDGAAADVLDAIEAELAGVVERLDTWRLDDGPFGAQRFWQPIVGSTIDAATPCMVDCCVIEHEAQAEIWRSLLVPERHGRALSLHDPEGVLADAAARARFDVAAHRASLTAELERIRVRRAIFASFPAKELERGRVADAHAMHQSMVFTPLVTLLGMRHRPLRFDFGSRYLHDELPGDVVRALLPIMLPGGAGQLPAATAAGIAWIDELLDDLDPRQLPIEQHAAQMREAFGA